jgi:hypothetical protein
MVARRLRNIEIFYLPVQRKAYDRFAVAARQAPCGEILEIMKTLNDAAADWTP